MKISHDLRIEFNPMDGSEENTGESEQLISIFINITNTDPNQKLLGEELVNNLRKSKRNRLVKI